MKRTQLILTLLVWILIPVYRASSQKIQWNSEPQKGYVFQITNDEAEKLLAGKKESDTIFRAMLHTLIDSFDVDTGWVDRPSRGHFILVRIRQNQLHCEYTSVFPYQVFLFKEYDMLALQVLDREGNVREDAKVKLWPYRIMIDTTSKTYRIENRWVYGTKRYVTVELDGFRSVFKIVKHKVPQWHNDYYQDDGPDFYSYMITDKNRYRPGETVRFKSYALTGSRVPLHREMEVWLTNYRKYLKVAELSPYRPGSYAGEFVLHDSLDLSLDKQYTLRLREKTGRIVAECHFSYEDYELHGYKLDAGLATYQQYYPDSNVLTLTATDENGLFLKDARARVLVSTQSVQESFQTWLILPDTLQYTEMDLDPSVPTRITIPAALFQKSNTRYRVNINITTSEGQRLDRTLTGNYFYSQYELRSRFVADSIRFELLKNGEPVDDFAAGISYDDQPHSEAIRLPYITRLNPATVSYHIRSGLLSRDFLAGNMVPELKLLGGILQDSFNIALENPQKLAISWYIYQGSTLLQKGSGTEIDYRSLITDRENTYYVELLYSFGGREQVKHRQYVFRDDNLDVSLEMPDRIYPGQEVEATIRVLDPVGKPVKNVDLTALATTAKLHYYLPDLPYYGPVSSFRARRDHFSKSDLKNRTAVLPLDYDKWVGPARLDTMKYYQFTYPEKKSFCYEQKISDSTQCAIYVMKNGMAKRVYVIEVNRLPVYYSWTSQPNRYVFYVPPEKLTSISLRLHDRVIVLYDLLFQRGTKTIISIDLDNLPTEAILHKLDDDFTGTEMARHIHYLARFYSQGASWSYLESESGFVPLADRRNNFYYHTEVLAGPIPAGRKTYVEHNRLRTTYTHEGGFNLRFEDNIVYKEKDRNLFPTHLRDASFDPMPGINDRVMTRSVFDSLNSAEPEEYRWMPKVLQIVDPYTSLRLQLPDEKAGSGIAGLLFEDCASGKTISPCRQKIHGNTAKFNLLPHGYNKLVILYNNGTYLMADSIPLASHHNILGNLQSYTIHSADENSRHWLEGYDAGTETCVQVKSAPETTRPEKRIAYTYHNTTGNVTGTIYSVQGEPLPGVTIIIKGTTEGTITDIDGRFALDISDYSAELVISFVGFITEEITVTQGSEVMVNMVEDILELSEIVVVGYGTTSKHDITGSVISVSGEDLSQLPPDEMEEDTEPEQAQQEAEEKLYRELLQLQSLRSNFSDVGFWEPRLYTDKHGEASFRVTFPDDITRWDAVVYAMNRQLQTGTARKSIRSYKPLMAELHVPRFLTRGDSAFFLGKVENYSSDTTIRGQVQWKEGELKEEQAVQFSEYTANTRLFVPHTTDTISCSFAFQRDDGYFDGEERNVPVVEQGTVRANGSLFILQNKDTVRLKAGENEKVTVEILDNQVAIYGEEVRYLLNYRYACNEQLASKLIGLINHKHLMEYEGKKFRYDRDVNKIIKRLLDNQNQEFLWSWWNVSEYTSYWMSAHILRALKYARDAGYRVNLDISNVVRKATYKYDFKQLFSLHDADLLHVLSDWGAEIDYARYLYKMDSLIHAEESRETGHHRHVRYSYLREKLMLLEVRQKQNLDYSRDSLLHYKKEGILGEVYFTDGKMNRYWYRNRLAANEIAYRIIRNDSLLSELKVPMQMYFLGTRREASWNTYQSSGILMNVLPDLLADGFSKQHTARLTLHGKVEGTLTEFPYRIELNEGEELILVKESGLPLYGLKYSRERVVRAKTGVEGFSIQTWFAGGSDQLVAGEPVNLVAEVTVEKDASFEYVMIEVPIPGACSYAAKPQQWYGVETHREYFREATVIFCERMRSGTYRFEIPLLPRFSGKYHINPAQVSLMYVPVVNANTDMKKISVAPRN